MSTGHAPIYSYQSKVNSDKSNGKSSLSSGIKDETLFWSSLSRCNNNQQGSSVSILHNKSFFCQKSTRNSFSIHGLPKQSLLKLGGTQIIKQFALTLKNCQTTSYLKYVTFFILM
jgi:hypothetical protein